MPDHRGRRNRTKSRVRLIGNKIHSRDTTTHSTDQTLLNVQIQRRRGTTNTLIMFLAKEHSVDIRRYCFCVFIFFFVVILEQISSNRAKF